MSYFRPLGQPEKMFLLRVRGTQTIFIFIFLILIFEELWFNVKYDFSTICFLFFCFFCFFLFSYFLLLFKLGYLH